MAADEAIDVFLARFPQVAWTRGPPAHRSMVPFYATVGKDVRVKVTLLTARTSGSLVWVATVGQMPIGGGSCWETFAANMDHVLSQLKSS